jgi:hypothetical protein
MKFLAPDAATSLLTLEKDTGGLVYKDMWRDSVDSLLATRTRKTSQSPGYSTHGYGLAFDLDLKTVLDEKKISYEDLLYILKKRGWLCHRRDGDGSRHEAEHFNYLGDLSEKYLVKTTLNPTTWQRPAEEVIYERYGKNFQIDVRAVQLLLSQINFFTGPITAQLDQYTREAILAFQRAWNLVEDGTASPSLCRVLTFVTAEKDMMS